MARFKPCEHDAKVTPRSHHVCFASRANRLRHVATVESECLGYTVEEGKNVQAPRNPVFCIAKWILCTDLTSDQSLSPAFVLRGVINLYGRN